MNRQQRRQHANKHPHHASGVSSLRSKLIEIALPTTLQQLRPELQKLLRQHADYLLTLPTSEVCVAASGQRTATLAIEKMSRLLPNPTHILQNPTTLQLLSVGVKGVDIQVKAGPTALAQLLGEMAVAAVTGLTGLLTAVEERLETLKEDPTPLGLTGASAETFSMMFTEFHDTIEELVEVARLFGDPGDVFGQIPNRDPLNIARRG